MGVEKREERSKERKRKKNENLTHHDIKERNIKIDRRKGSGEKYRGCMSGTKKCQGVSGG